MGRFRFLWNAFVIKLSTYFPPSWKNPLYRFCLGMKIGKNVAIGAGAEIDAVRPDLITLEDNVIIGMNAAIMTHEFVQNKVTYGEVKIEEGACIGAYSILRCGVTVGHNSIVGIGSYAHEDVPPREVWAGRPAKKLSHD